MFPNDKNDIKKSYRDGSDIKAMEHATLKVPYEILNKKYRLSQKTIDREVSQLNQSVYQLKRSTNLEQANKALDNVVAKLNVVKRKADESILDEIEAASLCKRRLEHLRGGVRCQDPVGLTIWKNRRLERLLVDHMLRSGYYDTAKKLTQATNIEPLTNINIYLAYRDIEISLSKKETAMCLAWCQENKSKLRKIESTLEFQLRQQEFIELVRNNKRLEAVYHARKYLGSALTQDCINNPHCQLICKSSYHHSVDDCRSSSSSSFKLSSRFSQRYGHRHSQPLQSSMSTDGDSRVSKSISCFCLRNRQIRLEIEITMGLLAYKSDTDIEPYRNLLSESRWSKLIVQFKQDIYSVFHLNSVSVFSVALQAGLSALKTPHCYRKSGKRDNDCPICNPVMNELAKNLPFPHCSQSKMICSISGQPLNENNPPLMLPNGHIYGELSLTTMARKNNGKLICPKTRDEFKLEQAQRVFIM